jgi:hypothetical protein
MNRIPWKRWTLLRLGVALPLACGSSEGSAPPSEEARSDTVELGVCYGKNTTCQVPTYVPLAPGPEHAVQCVDGPDLAIAWQATLGMLNCRVPECAATAPLVAAGAGRYWAVALLQEPGAEAELGGFGVFEFDATGALVGSVATDVRSPLEAPLPTQLSRAIDVDADGSLRWVTLTANRRGIEFRRYEHGPKQVSSDVAVTDAEALLGHAKWNADGSAVLAYRYLENFDPAVARSGRNVSAVARFDRNGGVLWNQTLRSHAAEHDEGVLWVNTRVAGVSAVGESTVRFWEIRSDMRDVIPKTRVARLDTHGNIVWAHQLENSGPIATVSDPNMRVLPDGSSLVVYPDSTPAADGSVARFVEKLDPSGQPSWRARLEGLSGSSDGPATFHDGERVIFASRAERTITVAVFDANASSCSQHALRVEPCEVLTDGGIGNCGEIAAAIAEPGRLYFGIRDQVGVANLP